MMGPSSAKIQHCSSPSLALLQILPNERGAYASQLTHPLVKACDVKTSTDGQVNSPACLNPKNPRQNTVLGVALTMSCRFYRGGLGQAAVLCSEHLRAPLMT